MSTEKIQEGQEIGLNLILNEYGINSFWEYMDKGVVDILVKLVNTKLEIG